MKVSVENLENDVVRLNIKVDNEVVEEELDRAYHKVVRQLNIPGFRKGKAPRRIVEQRYGRGILLEESYQQIIGRAYADALSETGVEPMAQPEISDLDFKEDGTDYTFTAVVPVRPTIELGTYKGIEMDKIEPVVTDEDVDRYIDQLRNQYAEYVTVDRNDLQDGDIATVDIETLVAGKPIPGGARVGITIRIGDDHFGPNTDVELLGLQVGEDREINVTLPENENTHEHAGKEAVIKVTLHEIRSLRIPELDAEFVADMEATAPKQDEGDEEAFEESDAEKNEEEIVQSFRQKIRSQLEKASRDRARKEFEGKLVSKVIEESKFELHERIVSEKVEEIRVRYTDRLDSTGITLKQYLGWYGINDDDFAKMIKSEAVQELSLRFVMEAIAEAEGIEVTDEEIDQWIGKRFDAKQATDPEVARYYKELAETSLKRTKAMELVINTSVPNVTEKTLSEISAETDNDADEAGDTEEAHDAQ